MTSDITLQNPDDLRKFADGVRKIASFIASHRTTAPAAVALPPVRFGQDATATDVPMELATQFSGSISDIDANVQTLVDKLNLIADTASGIADRYKTAAELDHLSAAEIQRDLGMPVT